MSESARVEVPAKAFRFGAVLFGFKETLLTNRELVDVVCERLLEMYNVEQRPAVESDEYYKQCIELVMNNEDASDVFYWLALLYIMPH
jgi:predicted NUDIX family phosphoesterase